MAEHEIELGGEVSIPFAAKFAVRYRRKWQARTGEFLQDVSDESGLSQEQIEVRVETDEQLEELLLDGLAKAGKTGDPEYRQALARVVASAFADDARVDEIEQLASQLVMLDPFALRVLRAAYVLKSGGLVMARYPIRIGDVLAETGARPEVIQAALARLAGFGLIANASALPESGDGLFATSVDQYWESTGWGRRAVELCSRHLPEGDAGSKA